MNAPRFICAFIGFFVGIGCAGALGQHFDADAPYQVVWPICIAAAWAAAALGSLIGACFDGGR